MNNIEIIKDTVQNYINEANMPTQQRITLPMFLRAVSNDIDLDNTKVRFCVTNRRGMNPLALYKKNPQECYDFVYWNNCAFKPGQYVIGLIRMDTDDRWLLCTIGKILSVDKSIPKHGGVACTYETLHQYDNFFGRLIIKYHNISQQMFRNATSIIDELEIDSILPSSYTGFDFPGYENVSLSYDELKTVIEGNYPSYQNTLKMQKAVYVLTDKSNGKLYVESATSDSGLLLSRWSSYVQNGHGGNVELKTLDFEHIKKYFQYTIIENYNKNTDDNYILQREAYWKNVLQTRKFGYNRN